MDVKLGSGAFAAGLDMARDLADSLVRVADGAGLPTVALLTDMNQVLGRAAGNALELREAIGYLTGGVRDRRLDEVVLALGAEMLVLGRLAGDPDTARAALLRALGSGAATERFSRMVTALGGPADLVDLPDRHLPRAPVCHPVRPSRAGFVTAIDVRRLGLAVVALGGGRRRAEDAVDPCVGLDEVAGLGEAVGSARPLALVHARSEAEADRAAGDIRAAFAIGDEPPGVASPVRERIVARAP